LISCSSSKDSVFLDSETLELIDGEQITFESHMDSLKRLNPDELITFSKSCVGCYGNDNHYFLIKQNGKTEISKIDMDTLYSNVKYEIETKLFQHYYDSVVSEKWNISRTIWSHYPYEAFTVSSAEYNLDYHVKAYELDENLHSYRVQFIKKLDSIFASVPDSVWIKD
jgi:hypothetical protein